MKTIIYLSFILLCLACKAQYNVVPLDGTEQNTSIINPNLPDYYKDLNNDLDAFVGTWKYQNGNTSFTISLKKVEQAETFGNNITDKLIGEYRYVENGIEIVNSLPGFNNPSLAENNLRGSVFTYAKYFPNCSACDQLKPRIKLIMRDPGRTSILLRLVLQYFSENGQEKLMGFPFIDAIILPLENTETRIPEQEYIFIKQ